MTDPKHAKRGFEKVTPEELVSWRKARKVTQPKLAEALSLSVRTLIRMENGERALPEGLESTLEMLPVSGPRAGVGESEAVPEPAAGEPAAAFDPEKAGLTEGRKSFVELGASSYWDMRDLGEGWQRVKGGVRVVNASIPDPINYLPPAWAAPDGVVTADGKVFHAVTGDRMRAPWLKPVSSLGEFHGSNLKEERSGKKRRPVDLGSLLDGND